MHTVPENRPTIMQQLKNCCINANEEHAKEKPSFSLKLNKFCARFGPDQTGHGLRVDALPYLLPIFWLWLTSRHTGLQHIKHEPKVCLAGFSHYQRRGEGSWRAWSLAVDVRAQGAACQQVETRYCCWKKGKKAKCFRCSSNMEAIVLQVCRFFFFISLWILFFWRPFGFSFSCKWI